VSIYEGYPLPHIILYHDCVDGDVINNSTKSRRSSVTASLRTSEREVVCDIKKKLCSVTLDFEKEMWR